MIVNFIYKQNYSLHLVLIRDINFLPFFHKNHRVKSTNCHKITCSKITKKKLLKSKHPYTTYSIHFNTPSLYNLQFLRNGIFIPGVFMKRNQKLIFLFFQNRKRKTVNFFTSPLLNFFDNLF